MEQQVLDEFQTSSNLNYSSVGKRFVAALIDGIILWIVGGVISLVVFGSFIMDANRVATEGFFAVFGSYYAITIVIQWLYYALQESSTKQATLGKIAMGVKVVSLEGNRISFAQATGRYFSKILSAIILMIGYIMAFFDDRKQALHDKLAGTLVVDSK